jgi:hypothetical protein
MGAEDAFQYYSCIWPGEMPGIGIVRWFDILACAPHWGAGAGIPAGAMRRLPMPRAWGDMITKHVIPS